MTDESHLKISCATSIMKKVLSNISHTQLKVKN